MPSPLYQWRNAFRLYIAPNWVASRWKMPFGATSTIEVFWLFGIHSTKSSPLDDWRFSMISSTSCEDIGPRKTRAAVMYLPSSGFTFEKKFRGEYAWLVSSWTLTSWYPLFSLDASGAWAMRKKWRRGKGPS